MQLHKLVYAIAVAAILHYWWHKAGKPDFGTVSLYALVVFWLLGVRLWWAVRDRYVRVSHPASAACKKSVTDS